MFEIIQNNRLRIVSFIISIILALLVFIFQAQIERVAALEERVNAYPSIDILVHNQKDLADRLNDLNDKVDQILLYLATEGKE